MDKITLNHEGKNMHEVFDIDPSKETLIVEVLTVVGTNKVSYVVENIVNNEKLSDKEKLFCVLAAGKAMQRPFIPFKILLFIIVYAAIITGWLYLIVIIPFPPGVDLVVLFSVVFTTTYFSLCFYSEFIE